MNASFSPSAALAGKFLPGGRVLAAPSWVFPGNFLENCRFLAGKVDEAGLLFFETIASLSCGPEDLPPALADLPLRYHLHLPLDLPLHRPEEAAGYCAALFRNTAFLGPVRGVLHPPSALEPDGCTAERRLRDFLGEFVKQGGRPEALLLENIPENDLLCLEKAIEEYDLHICLDMGHAQGYGQDALMYNERLLRRVGMVHLNAPGTGAEKSRHLPLSALQEPGVRAARRLLHAVPEDAVLMLELFHWPDIEESLPLLRQWLEAPKR